MHREKTMWKYGEKMAISKPRRETLEETYPAYILISDF